MSKGALCEFLFSGVRDHNTDLPLSLGKVYTYAPGTTTPKSIYTDINLSVAHSNPITLDAFGRKAAYGADTYRLVIRDATDTVTLYDIDNVPVFNFRSTNVQSYAPIFTGVTGTPVILNNSYIESVDDLEVTVSLYVLFQAASAGSTVTISLPIQCSAIDRNLGMWMSVVANGVVTNNGYVTIDIPTGSTIVAVPLVNWGTSSANNSVNGRLTYRKQ